MNAQPQFTPDMVYNLIVNNPQGRVFVENLAKLNQLQQAAVQAQQFIPQMQQFAQNPAQAVQSIGNWAQGAVNHMQQAESQPVQEGNPQMNSNNMVSMAMEIVGKFEKAISDMSQKLDALVEDNKTLTSEIQQLREDFSKLL